MRSPGHEFASFGAIVGVIVALPAVAGCGHILPTPVAPQPMPPQVLPLANQTLPPMGTGLGRALLDCVNNTCKAQIVLSSSVGNASAFAQGVTSGQMVVAGSSSSSESWRDICSATPCYADLPPGNYKIKLQASDGPTKEECYNLIVNDFDKVERGKSYACETAEATINISEGWYSVVVAASGTRRYTGEVYEISAGTIRTWTEQPKK